MREASGSTRGEGRGGGERCARPRSFSRPWKAVNALIHYPRSRRFAKSYAPRRSPTHGREEDGERETTERPSTRRRLSTGCAAQNVFPRSPRSAPSGAKSAASARRGEASLVVTCSTCYCCLSGSLLSFSLPSSTARSLTRVVGRRYASSPPSATLDANGEPRTTRGPDSRSLESPLRVPACVGGVSPFLPPAERSRRDNRPRSTRRRDARSRRRRRTRGRRPLANGFRNASTRAWVPAAETSFIFPLLSDYARLIINAFLQRKYCKYFQAGKRTSSLSNMSFKAIFIARS